MVTICSNYLAGGVTFVEQGAKKYQWERVRQYFVSICSWLCNRHLMVQVNNGDHNVRATPGQTSRVSWNEAGPFIGMLFRSLATDLLYLWPTYHNTATHQQRLIPSHSQVGIN